MIHALLAANTGTPPTEPPPISPAAIYVLGGLFGLIVMAIAVLNLVKLCKDIFGRKPSIDVDLHAKADKDDINSVKLDIKGFVPSKDFDAYIEAQRLRDIGLEKQISESRHDWRLEFGAWQNFARERDEERAERLKHLEQQVNALGQNLAAVGKQGDLILASLHNLEAKVDRNNERRPAARA